MIFSSTSSSVSTFFRSDSSIFFPNDSSSVVLSVMRFFTIGVKIHVRMIAMIIASNETSIFVNPRFQPMIPASTRIAIGMRMIQVIF